ncbi:hypothetical protein AURDEDRAFT_111720 [Auricularia subglabra TFB-10046 SS5]|nr:hypothetical protein AURDEDRAFT_111720 [Auricularia subglabra TFB-10046 SS5]
MSRPLTLHLSALSDAEYDLYTSSLAEISVPPAHDVRSDKYWEDRVVSLREARGWMRGRYGVDGKAIDQILRYFSPTLGPADTLSAGQFFAAMRLVLYAQRGADPERSLVFVQPPATPRPVSTPTPDLPPPPMPPIDKPPPPPPLSANPFQRSATISLRAPKTAPLLTTADPFSAPPPASSGNPFLRNSNALPTPATSPTPSHFPLPPASSAASVSPPLPPRKPNFLPPPRHQALSTASTTGSIRAAPPPPPKPANLSMSTSGATHMTSELMTKSLSAARALDVRRRAESDLAGTRMLEVIRSTTSASKSPPGSTRPSPPPSIFPASSSSASDTSSLERVAVATTRLPETPITTNRFPSPERERPPPLLRSATQTPRGEPASSSAVDDSPLGSPTGAARPGRSKSVHSPSGSGPPPIPRRPRPESLQLGPAGANGTLKRSVSAAQPGHRHNTSIGGGPVNGADVMASLRESFGALGLQARDKIERMEMRMEKRLRTTSRGVESERLVRDGDMAVNEDVTGEDSDEERARRGWRPLQ